jgi:cobalt-precorrin-5B (C1)-methyltransferase
MIEQEIGSVFMTLPLAPCPLPLKVTISIPDGEQRALKTLNARLGIIGGLSILGTTGIVRPISAKAWTDTIDAALDVARACACQTVVFSTGRTSELAAQRLIKVRGSRFEADKQTGNQEPGTLNLEPRSSLLEPLPEEAFVMMGDHVAHALRSSLQRGFSRPLIACQFAKLLKIACGYENTHAAASEMDLARFRTWAEEERLPSALLDIISSANTAREIAVTTHFEPRLVALAGRMAARALITHAPGIEPIFLVADYNGRIVAEL